MKKIIIINGHPNSDSFNFGLFEAYKKGALAAGADHSLDETLDFMEFIVKAHNRI